VMMALSFTWLIVALGLLIPSITSFLLAATPHPPFVNLAWLGFVLVVAVILLPPIVGLIGHLVPAEDERPDGAGVATDVLRGYLLAPLISGLLIFLAGVGMVRKVRSRAHGWSDVHVPIVVKPKGYDQVIDDLTDVLDEAGLRVKATDAPWVLTLPARLLTAVASSHVRKLRPDRVMELEGRSLRVGVYPSDIAISGPDKELTRARAAILSRLATSAVHLTTSAEAQKVEDRIEKLARPGGGRPGPLTDAARREIEAIDETLVGLTVPTDEWDILYRLRLQVERDLLVGAKPGTEFPGDGSKPSQSPPRPVAASRTG
jgi:hypothetical protein